MENIRKLKLAAALAARSETVAGICVGLLVGAALLAGVHFSGVRVDRLLPAQQNIRLADLRGETASDDVRHLADWIADSRDAAERGFVIVDKKYAKAYAFDGQARLLAFAPVLLGSAHGDDSVSGVGAKPLAEVLPEERTTPAGRFVGERGHDTRGDDVVWVDYDAAVSIHRVLTNNPGERRLERLATPEIEDNRISNGCINVPAAFYETFIGPLFANRRAIVYVLPESKSVDEVFGSYDVAARRPGTVPRNQLLSRMQAF